MKSPGSNRSSGVNGGDIVLKSAVGFLGLRHGAAAFDISGYLRLRTDGLMVPIVAHILADLVIGYILLSALGNV